MRTQRAADDVLSTLDMSELGRVVQLYAGGRIGARLFAALLSLHGGKDAEATDFVGACVRTRCEEVRRYVQKRQKLTGYLHLSQELGRDVLMRHGNELAAQ